jgi:hypothetical protein
MKIIEGPKEWTQIVKCYECKATVEIGMSDVLIGSFGGDYTERGTDHIYAPCCVCGTHLKLKSVNSMPPLVVQKARKNGYIPGLD